MIPILYHGSVTSKHGRGQLIDSADNPQYLGHYTLLMDTGSLLRYARRESFTILEDDVDVKDEVIELDILI